MSFGPLVAPDWLRDHLADAELLVVDCRFVLGRPGAGQAAWLDAHIPGAAVLDVDRDLSAEPGPRGRHPLPSAEAFEAAARRAGIRGGSRVVAYDEAGEGGAARLWWLLRHFGHDEAAVLDGGLRAWREAGGELRGGPEETDAGDFVARPRENDTVSAEEVGATSVPLFDARAPERFRGEIEPIDPIAGHIPGARNVPAASVAPKGRFRSAAELRKELGDQPFVAYCGSGVTACTLVLAGEIAGVKAKLYPGSWSEWVASGRPPATP
jgi:thiosulfate/3-mercaptopyruvate sulfurtransferase